MTSAVLPRASARPPLAGQRQAALGGARQRLMTGLLLSVGVTAVLGLRLADLALLKGRPDVSVIDPAAGYAPKRADIVDRHGVELARTFDAFAISVEPPQLVGDPRALADRIAAILGQPSADIYAELTHKGGYRFLARRALPAQAQRINDIGEPAIRIERTPERLYPNLELAAHVLGYTSIDGRGRTGIERVLDGRLGDAATRGAPVSLSLDSRVQQAMEHELGIAIAKHKAKGGAGIVLDAATGEVIAMASLPTFNPNAEGGATPDARFNRATQGVYELGSTFKALTVAMALERGVITSMQQTFDATHGLRMGRFTINDLHPQRKWMTTPEVFIHSSNIGTARMATAVGGARQRDFLDKLGFLAPVSGELAERGRTLYPPVANWGELATMTVGYGHGMSVTPLHLATAYAALVNGGIWRPATVLKLSPGKAPAGTRVFSEDTSLKMRALMRMVVTKGTGRRAEAAGYRVGGKTGTAEIAKDGRYVRNALVVNFAGAFPMDRPRYVVVAMIDEPQNVGQGRTAGIVAAPVVKQVIERIGPALGVPPDLERDIDIDAVLGLVPETAREE